MEPFVRAPVATVSLESYEAAEHVANLIVKRVNNYGLVVAALRTIKEKLYGHEALDWRGDGKDSIRAVLNKVLADIDKESHV